MIYDDELYDRDSRVADHGDDDDNYDKCKSMRAVNSSKVIKMTPRGSFLNCNPT